MTSRHTFTQNLPLLWLISDARNDAALGNALRDLPRGSGFIFRHYHLDETARRNRFDELAAIARECGHAVILSGGVSLASRWSADGIYGAPGGLPQHGTLLRLAAAHNAAEIARANRILADAVLISPVFPTRSHPGAAVLGNERFHALAAMAQMPVIALGGMTAARASELEWPRWAAIDGLSLVKDS